MLQLQLGATDSLVCTIAVKPSYFTVDANGMLYYVTASNEISRTDTCGNHTITYSNIANGTPTLIDVGNPLKILAFYKDQQKVVVLDKTMSEIAVLSLNNINGKSYMPSLLCRATGGDHIWLFDEFTQSFVRLDESGNKIAASEPIYQIFEKSEVPLWMVDIQDHLYVYTSGGLIYLFDAYGTPGTTFMLNDAPFSAYRNMFLIKGPTGFSLVNIFTNEVIALPLPATGDVRLQNDLMYYYDGDHINVLQFR